MQTTTTTDVNYISNPTFELGTAGWFVAGGVLTQTVEQAYNSGHSGKFIPSSIYGFIDFPLIGMKTGVNYIAQARVFASAGQEVFIQFDGGGATRYTATGGWDLLVSQPMLQTSPAFNVQVGLGSSLLINVQDSSILTDSVANLVNYGLNKQNIVLSDTINSFETIGISIKSSVSQVYLYDLKVSVSDSTVTDDFWAVNNFMAAFDPSTMADTVKVSETYSILVAGGTQFNSALLVSVNDVINNVESYGYTADVLLTFISDLNVNVSDTTVTTEAYQVGAFKSGSVYLVSVTDNIAVAETVFPRALQSAANAIYVDSVMLQKASVAGAYFDGSSGNGYHWSGAPWASTSFYRNWELNANNPSTVPNNGVLISWTRAVNGTYNYFTIGSSTIGGPDFMPGTSTFPTYFNQYQYGEYSTYLMGMSINKNIGQFPYGAFGSQLDLTLDNSNFLFLPQFDPVIGNFIINGRPVMFQTGYNGELVPLFSGISTKPSNNIKNRTLNLTAFDGMDYLNSFISQGGGPLALASNGYYANMAAQNIIADLLAEAGFSTAQYYAEQSLQSNIGFLAPKGNTIGSIISKICEAEQALFYFNENGVPIFWNRQHIPTNNTVQWSFAYKSILDYQTEDTPIINDVIVKANPRAVQAKQNIWQLTSPILIPNAQNTSTITNLAVNPNFIASTGGYFNSPETITVNDNITTVEYVQATSNPLNVKYWIFDSTQLSEAVTVSVVFAAFAPQLYETVATYESYSVKVGANNAFNSALNLAVSDTVSTQEFVFPNHSTYLNVPLLWIDSIATAEIVSIKVVNASFSPSVYDSTVTDEDWNISSLTMTGWGTANSSVVRSLTDQAPVSTSGSCGQFTSLGNVNSYLFQQVTVTPAVQYVAQIYVKAPGGVNVTAKIVQNGHIINTTTISATGGWDLVKITPFVTENTVTTMQLQIYTNTAGTIKVAAPLIQLGVGATSVYFDGSKNPTADYVFSWTGTAQISTSLATPCGAYALEADFQDNDGELPVTSVTAPTYNNSNLDSTYLTNLNSDNTGLNQNANIILQSTVLNGSKYVMTFINTYTQPIYLTQCSIYGTPAKIIYTITQEYKDPTSIVLYGTNPANNGQPLEIDNDLIQDPSTAQSDAYILVNDYSKPYQRIVASVFPNYALQIGDAIQATIDDTASTLIYTIVGITNSLTEQGEPGQVLELEIKNIIQYFTINTSIIGGTDSIAP